MLAKELEKHNVILEKFMFDVSALDSHTKILKESILAKLLEKTFIKKMSDLTIEIQL